MSLRNTFDENKIIDVSPNNSIEWKQNENKSKSKSKKVKIRIKNKVNSNLENIRNELIPRLTLNQTKFLKKICPDSHICIAFGNDTNKINNYFDEFNNFNMLYGDIIPIGNESKNGFLKMLTFEKNGYFSNVVLKSNKKRNSDNLVYEGLVGFFLNKKGKIFPCFLETYGIYEYAQDLYNFISDNQTTSIPHEYITNENLIKVKINADNFKLNACDDSLTKTVMIQHLKNSITLDNILNDNKNINFINHELLYVLFQIYIPLSKLSNKFTHYDLHEYNILFYEPAKLSYINYHYHFSKELVITFKSKYIVKIIDYGRSYFANNNTTLGNSYNIYKTVRTKCEGESKNYGFYEKKSNNLIPYQKNESYDLKLLINIKDIIEDADDDFNLFLTDFFNKMPDDYENENLTSGLPSKINNVNDASRELQDLMQNLMMQAQHDKYYEDMKCVTKFGDLHIFMDDGKPMIFQKYIDDLQDELNMRDKTLYPNLMPSHVKASSSNKISLSNKKSSSNKKSLPNKKSVFSRLTSLFTKKKKVGRI